MGNTITDFTINIKNSIDSEYDGENNMPQNYDEDKRVLDDNTRSSVEESYDDSITIDHESADDDVSIAPNPSSTVDTIRLIKIRSINELSDELDNINKTNIPALLDFKYIQERRQSEYRKVATTLNAFKDTTGAHVVLLGSTQNVVLVTPENIRVLTQ